MFADLHLHSIFSDSTRSPENIVEIAKDKKVSLISICDHYTIASFERLADACKSSDVAYVSGIEMDANLRGENYHILAYNFDVTNQKLLDFIKRQSLKNQKDCEAMIVKMCNDYPQLSLSDYMKFDYPKDLGGWKYAHYAAERGIFESYEEAIKMIFPTYFKAGEETYSVDEFCRIVKQANGIPVLAHPGELDSENLTALLRDMQESGIEGVECYYPSHSKRTTETCLDYCRKNNMRITSGSDCHGDYDRTDGFSIGSLQISIDMLDLRGIV